MGSKIFSQCHCEIPKGSEMKRQFFVICRQPCNNCGGDGHVDISQEIGHPVLPIANRKTVECPDCKGARHVEFKVPLAEAIAELAMTNGKAAL